MINNAYPTSNANAQDVHSIRSMEDVDAIVSQLLQDTTRAGATPFGLNGGQLESLRCTKSTCSESLDTLGTQDLDAIITRLIPKIVHLKDSGGRDITCVVWELVSMMKGGRSGTLSSSDIGYIIQKLFLWAMNTDVELGPNNIEPDVAHFSSPGSDSHGLHNENVGAANYAKVHRYL